MKWFKLFVLTLPYNDRKIKIEYRPKSENIAQKVKNTEINFTSKVKKNQD